MYGYWLKSDSKRNIRYCFDDFIQLYAKANILATNEGQLVVRINYLEERPYPLEAQDANDVIRELLYAVSQYDGLQTPSSQNHLGR